MFLKNLNREEQNAFFALAKCLMAADRVLDENEVQLLKEFLDEMDLTEDQIEVMTSSAALEVLSHSSMTSKKQIFIELVGLSLCDESVDKEEQKALQDYADNFGFTEEMTGQLTDIVNELFLVYKKIGELVAE